MPIPTIVQRPYTRAINYYNNGVYTNGNTVDNCLDPNDTPVVFAFASETYATPPVRSFVVFGPTPPFPNPNIDIVAGDSFTIFGERFVAADNPVENQFATCTAADYDSRLASVQSLADSINSNNNLNWRFVASIVVDITLQITRIRIDARKAGAIYNFVVGDNLSANISGTPTYNSFGFFPIGVGVDANRGSLLQEYEYGFRVEIWVPQEPAGSEWGRQSTNPKPVSNLLATVESQWNETNRVDFDISRYIQSLTRVVLPTALISAAPSAPAKIILSPIAVSPYFLRYYEVFNGGYDVVNDLPSDFDVDNNQPETPTNRKVRAWNQGETEMRWTAPGAFQLGVLNPTFYQYWQYRNGDNIIQGPVYRDIVFASILPDTTIRKLRRRIRETLFTGASVNNEDLNWEFLYFYLQNDQYIGRQRAYRLRHDFVFIDGTTYPSVYSHETTSLNLSGLYCANVSLTRIGLLAAELSESKRVANWTTTLEVNYGIGYQPMSVPYYYQLDLNYEPDRYFKVWWRNSLSTLDCFEFEGIQTNEIDTKPSEFQRTLPLTLGWNRDIHVNAILTRDNKVRISISTGWIDSANYQYVSECAKSNEVWILGFFPQLQTTGFLVQGAIATINKPRMQAVKVVDINPSFNNNDTLYNLELTLEYALDENSTVS